MALTLTLTLRPAKYLGRGTDMRSGLHAHSFVAYTRLGVGLGLE